VTAIRISPPNGRKHMRNKNIILIPLAVALILLLPVLPLQITA
jgi:hypothetical protein